MKSIAKKVLSILGVTIVAPIFLLIFFLPPAEFLASSWHMIRTTASTQGVIDRSEVSHSSKGTSGSVMQYSYAVDGRSYTSTRHQAGFSHRNEKTGGDEFSIKHPAGTRVVVHYDPDQPAFALIAYGWPTWSIGLPLALFGMFFGNWFRLKKIRSQTECVNDALARAITPTGFLTIFVLNSTIAPWELLWVLALYAGTFVVLLSHAVWKLRKRGFISREKTHKGQGKKAKGQDLLTLARMRESDPKHFKFCNLE